MTTPQNIKPAEDAQLEQIGIVSTIVEGQQPITVRSIDGTTRELVADEPIYLYDVILTTDNSYIKIILDDDTVFKLGPNSEASLDKYLYDPDASSGEFEAFVSTGSFHYISGKISGDNQGQHTLIKTPSAQIGIRGSEITAEIAEDGSTTILHMAGLVTIISNYTQSEVLVYERGTSIYIPNENTSHTVDQISEEQLQIHTQEWQMDTYNTLEIESNTPEYINTSTSEYKTDQHDEQPEIEESADNDNNQYFPVRTDIHDFNEPLDKPPTEDVAINKSELFKIHSEIREAGFEEHVKHKVPSEQHTKIALGDEDEIHVPDKPEFPPKTPDEPTEPTEPTEPPPVETIARDDAFDMGNNDTITIAKQDLLSNDKYAETDSFSILNTINGIVTIDADNITFTRDTQFSGITENGFDYSIGKEIAHVSITGNLSPIAVTDKVITLENQPIIFNFNDLLGNDFDPNPTDSINITGIDNPSNGTIQLTNNALIFTPINAGNASFEYTITDDHGANTIGLVKIEVLETSKPKNDTFNTIVTEPLPITLESLLSNDNNDNFTIIDAKIIENGSLEYDGNIIFVPDKVGTAKFEYTVQDSDGVTNTAIVTITVEGFAVDDILGTIPKNLTTGFNNLLNNDTGPEPMTITAVDNAENGTVILLEDNIVKFTPTDNFVGEASFEYTVSTSDGYIDTATATLTVENSPPVDNTPPEINWSTEPLTFNVSEQAKHIGEVSVIDDDSIDFAGGILKAAITQNRTANDILKIEDFGAIKVSGNTSGNIYHNEVKIGDFITDFISGTLLISLNEAANANNTGPLIQAITYQNISQEPEGENRTLTISLSDGDSYSETTVSREIQITTENIAPVANHDPDIEAQFNAYTTIPVINLSENPVPDLLGNDIDANPTDIIRILEDSITPETENIINIELVGNEIQLFIDALKSDEPTESAKFSYKITDGQDSSEKATVTVNPNNVINVDEPTTDGVDIILGGQGGDVFNPSDGADILFGKGGDDTFNLNSNIAGLHIKGGEGDDKISLNGIENHTLNLVQNRSLPESSQLKLDGVDIIDITGKNNQLHLQIKDVLKITDGEDSGKLTIDGGASNIVNSLGQGWKLSPSSIDGYNVYTSDAAQLLVHVDINNQFIS
ncbi:cadherin-like domain-containing protein [Candidatus Halobeggiatoa sp. HSG11]|nr:cadherin-like domain-containing protein [Candidatus Halobeggiatoa sp. HSG11]